MSEKPSRTGGSSQSDTLEGGDADSLDTLFELLSNRRRRYVLSCLNEYENPMALADLADEVAARENGTPITQTSAEEVKRIYISLYHTHVPKLEAADVVRYSQDQDMVALEAEFELTDECGNSLF